MVTIQLKYWNYSSQKKKKTKPNNQSNNNITVFFTPLKKKYMDILKKSKPELFCKK